MSERRAFHHSAPRGYWAVFKGHKPGIYASWRDCNLQTTDYTDGTPVWRKFPPTEQGFEDAKTFCTVGPHRARQEAADDTPDDSSDDSSDSDEADSSGADEDGCLMVRLDTNFKASHARRGLKQNFPRWGVVFNMNGDDVRNMQDFFRLPNPSAERCIAMALVAFLQWCKKPSSARFRHEDQSNSDIHDFTAAFDPSVYNEIIIQTPCKSIESKFSPSDKNSRRSFQGVERTIATHLAWLQEHSVAVTFITVAEDAKDREVGQAL